MIQFRKKHGPKRHSAGDGFSRFEAEVNAELEANGIFNAGKTEPIPYDINAKYVPDFVLPNGIIIETKGWFPPEDRRKMANVKRCHPELDIRFIFLKDQPITKGSKTLYSTWAEKHGFPWALKTIPVDWIYEERRDTNTDD